MHVTIDAFSQGKQRLKNEDWYGYANKQRSFAVADGATDKGGQTYGGRTGGELAAQAVVNTALETRLSGRALVENINARMQAVYAQSGNTRAAADKRFRFIASFVSATVENDDFVITQVGDVRFRHNGELYVQENLIERDAIEARVQYIADASQDYLARTGSPLDLASERGATVLTEARAFIKPFLYAQFDALNEPSHPRALFAIDGFAIPDRAIKTYRFPLRDTRTLEIATDGYPLSPAYHANIKSRDWEEAFTQVQAEDPFRVGRFAATKTADDRTILIARCNHE